MLKDSKADLEMYRTFLPAMLEYRDKVAALSRGMFPRDVGLLDLIRKAQDVADISKSEIDKQSHSITRAIDELGKELGVAVLDNNRPREVTPDGMLLATLVHGVLRGLKQIATFDERRSVHISAIDMAVNFWIPEALSKTGFFETEENRKIDLRIEVREWWQVLRDVRDGIADFGIGTAMPCAGLSEDLFLVRPHVLLFHRNHKFANKKEKEIDVTALSGERIACLRDFIAPLSVDTYLSRNGVTNLHFIEALNSAHLLSFVRNNVAVAFITNDAIPLDGEVLARPVRGRIALASARDAIYTRAADEQRPFGSESDAARRVRECISSYWRGNEWKKGRYRFTAL